MSSRQPITRKVHGQDDSKVENGTGIEREIRTENEERKTSLNPDEGEQINVHTKLPTIGL